MFDVEEKLMVKRYFNETVVYVYEYIETYDDYVEGSEYKHIEVVFDIRDKKYEIERVYYKYESNLLRDESKQSFETGYENGTYWFRNNFTKRYEESWDTYKKSAPYIEEAIEKMKKYVKQTAQLMMDVRESFNESSDDEPFIDPEERAMKEILEYYERT